MTLTEVDAIRLAIGHQESRHARSRACASLREAEFQVFSQWGEDGIIQYLVARVAIGDDSFVEFGVQDYAESNTRFLLCHDHWRGLIIDGDTTHQQFIRDRGLDWRYDITAVSSFITRENVNQVIGGAGFTGDIGLLSIDVDGNDYWLLDAVSVVSPRILVVEYNSTFGPEQAVTVPYRPDFRRTAAHFSNLYYGASIRAICELARSRNYACVGGNSAGNNAFFVRRDVLGDLPEVSARDAWVRSRFRESRDRDGRLTCLGSHARRLREIGELPLVDIITGQEHAIRDLLDSELRRDG
jgi:hypothetical protein